MLSRGLFIVSPKAHLLFWTYWYRFRHGPVSNFINALYFLQVAWMFARGKVVFIKSELAWANGGYKYILLTLSKKPLSPLNDYTDMGES
mgnify:CR=1 FL=1